MELAERQRSINRIQKILASWARKKALQLLTDDALLRFSWVRLAFLLFEFSTSESLSTARVGSCG
jgi:hypothetical protein